MTDLVKYPTDVLNAVYQTHRYMALDKLVNGLENGYRQFYRQNVVLAVKLDLWDRDGRQVRLYQQERQVLRAIYVLAHQQNSAIVRFTPAQLMEVLGYTRMNENDFSPAQRERVLRALNNLFDIHVEVEMKLGSGGMKKLYGHFLDSYAVETDREGKILQYAVQVNVLIGADLSRFKLMPANLPKLMTRHGPDQAVTTFVDFCLLWEGQTIDWGLETWMEQLQLDPTRRSRNMRIIEHCAQWGMENGLVASWQKGRMQQDKRRVKYTMVIAPQRYPGWRTAVTKESERPQEVVDRFYELLGTAPSEQKRMRDTAIADKLLAEGFSMDEIMFTVEWTVQHVSGVTSFGLIPHVIHQALKVRRDAQNAEEAKREGEARIQEQLRQEEEEWERAQRLEEIRASLSEEALQAFKRHAEDELAKEGVDRERVGYNILLRLKMDELIDQEYMRREEEEGSEDLT